MQFRFRLGGLNELSTIDGEGISFVVYFQGCRRRCKGCHNPELQPLNGGELVSLDSILDRLGRYAEWYDSVVLQGGEPLEQAGAVFYLFCHLKQRLPRLKRWLYTGRDIGDVSDRIKQVCDVIVAGEFREDLHVPGRFPASTNQIVWRAET